MKWIKIEDEEPINLAKTCLEVPTFTFPRYKFMPYDELTPEIIAETAHAIETGLIPIHEKDIRQDYE